MVGPHAGFRGGIARFTSALARELRRRHRVRFYSFHRQYPGWLFPGNSRALPGAADDGSVRSLDGVNPLTWWRTARRIAGEGPDLLLLQWWTPFWWPLAAVLGGRARRAGVPVLTLAHQLVEPDSSFAEWFVTRRALAGSDGLIVLTEEDVGMARRALPRLPVRLAPLPPLEPPPAFPPGRGEARRRWGLSPDRPVLLLLGFVRRYKGLEVLLDALARVPGVELLVAGEFWQNEAPYRDRIRRLGLGDRVVLVNRYLDDDELAACLAAADALVLPYLSGAQSAVGSSAVAAGLPVIASAVGGLAELVEPGVTGLVVPPGDPEALAGAIRELVAGDFAARARRAAAACNGSRAWPVLVGVIEELAARLAAGRVRS